MLNSSAPICFKCSDRPYQLMRETAGVVYVALICLRRFVLSVTSLDCFELYTTTFARLFPVPVSTSGVSFFIPFRLGHWVLCLSSRGTRTEGLCLYLPASDVLFDFARCSRKKRGQNISCIERVWDCFDGDALYAGYTQQAARTERNRSPLTVMNGGPSTSPIIAITWIK